MNAPAKGSPIEIVLADSAGGEDVLRGVLLGRFDGDHVEVKFDDLPFKAIVDRRLVRKLQVEGEAS
ncbi:hypothetical protein IYX23_03825 [Methylocystis sp. L43]|uniref:hypothetical protein n=1 Tax=unclassified Methylocystis TaxID=2625913 RepID=UPI0018C206F0|nr:MULTISPECIES: hypothetical protein [unclassified Methylocystis]MBG0796824.1 hypothetical protein [Methylocystis sp. L43]MBG0806111.1 hypothetical protein [Methylocystis sp. H15]